MTLAIWFSSRKNSRVGPPKTKLSIGSVAQRQIGNTARPHLIFTRRTHPIPRSQKAWKLEILSPKNTACHGTVRDRASQRNRPTFADIITASGLLLPRLPDVWPSWLGETALPSWSSQLPHLNSIWHTNPQATCSCHIRRCQASPNKTFRVLAGSQSKLDSQTNDWWLSLLRMAATDLRRTVDSAANSACFICL